MKISQTYRADSASQEPKSALRKLMQRLGLTFLACTLAVGATEAQQVAPPIAVSWSSLKWRSDVRREYSVLRAGIFKAWGLSIRWRLGGARTSSHAPVHRLDEPTGISLGMVASPQCPLPCRPAKSL